MPPLAAGWPDWPCSSTRSSPLRVPARACVEPLLNCHRLICAVTVLTPSPRVKTNTCTEKTKPRESIVPVSNQVRDQPPNPPHAPPFEPFRRASTLASMDAARRLCESDGMRSNYAIRVDVKCTCCSGEASRTSSYARRCAQRAACSYSPSSLLKDAPALWGEAGSLGSTDAEVIGNRVVGRLC